MSQKTPSTAAQQRRHRQAEALRANLRRRKDQARGQTEHRHQPPENASETPVNSSTDGKK